MDLSETLAPNSEQVNAEDLLAGPIIVTITGVERGNKEQPVFVHLAEFPNRTYRPGKTMRRLMVAVWGPDSKTYVGRSMQIYCDPTIKFGPQTVGGIRISHMSGIDGPREANLTVSRGERAPFIVQPLTTASDAAGWLRAATTLPELQGAWGAVQQGGFASVPELIALKDERKAVLSDAGV